MLKKYPEIAPGEELKTAPTPEILNAILNYSKSIEVKKAEGKPRKILINLN